MLRMRHLLFKSSLFRRPVNGYTLQSRFTRSLPICRPYCLSTLEAQKLRPAVEFPGGSDLPSAKLPRIAVADVSETSAVQVIQHGSSPSSVDGGDCDVSSARGGDGVVMGTAAKLQSSQNYDTTTSQSSSSYDPSKVGFDPATDTTWQGPTPFSAVAATMLLCQDHRRTEAVQILANFFRSVLHASPSELEQCAYLFLNDSIGPVYEGKQLHIGRVGLLELLSEMTGKPVDDLKLRLTASDGFDGLIEEEFDFSSRVANLTVGEVYGKLHDISELRGKNSTAERQAMIRELIEKCGCSAEAACFFRILERNLRIGLNKVSVLSALGRAFEQRLLVQRDGLNAAAVYDDCHKRRLISAEKFFVERYNTCPDLASVFDAVNKEPGIPLSAKLEKSSALTVGSPVRFMKAHSTNVDDILKRFDEQPIVCQYKYMGHRVQIHFDRVSKEVKLFTSSCKSDSGAHFPAVREAVERTVQSKKKTPSFIMDCEVAVWDVATDRNVHHQKLSQWKKAKVSDENAEKTEQPCPKLKLRVYPFDVLHYAGRDLLNQPLRKRQTHLASLMELFSHNEMFHPVEELPFASLDRKHKRQLNRFFKEARRNTGDGLVVKLLDSLYEPGKRSHSWLKLKTYYAEELADTLDLVVIGGLYGEHRRSGVYGSYLLACYDPTSDTYQSICMVGGGFDDDELERFTRKFKRLVLPERPANYDVVGRAKTDESNVLFDWFKPKRVWEIKADGFTESDLYRAAYGLVVPDKGISLRFPCFQREREDKTPKEATTPEQIFEMERTQNEVKEQRAKERLAEKKRMAAAN